MRTSLAPLKLDDDTWLIGNRNAPPGEDIGVAVQSMLILGDEPVLVDTGEQADAENWLRDASAIVDPKDVRWIFLTHEDLDHAGNVLKMLELAPKATLVTTWFACERFSHGQSFPMDRVRWVRDGEFFDVGDRRLRAITPPLVDGPTTRGLLDEKSRIYWAADAFSCPSSKHAPTANDMSDEEWIEGFRLLGPRTSPWVEYTSQEILGGLVSKLAAVEPSWIATCHGPPMQRPAIDRALRETPKIAGLAPATEPDNEALLAMLAETGIL
ncbi:MAG: MBL fold metallo-hydrolase [Pseudomonadota bacterium]